tara:strand:- start:251 stop:436 length:186 start_codon:yes stop_codon:yes gene_type:complete
VPIEITLGHKVTDAQLICLVSLLINKQNKQQVAKINLEGVLPALIEIFEVYKLTKMSEKRF